MKKPLNKRLPRELKSEFPKYLIIFVFLTVIIGFISGFFVASGSMKVIYDESFEKYNIEDGNFALYTKADETLLQVLEEQQVTVHENFYIERETDNVDSKIRIYKNRTEVNRVCVMEGKEPQQEAEIAIDRMYADNNGIQVGDILVIDDVEWTVCGLVALSDYSALYASPSDMMFDATKFGVAVVSKDGFARLGDAGLSYNYSWIYDEKPLNDEEAKERAEQFLTVLSEHAIVTNYIPGYCNQAIQFTGEDMDSDRVMFITFLYIVIAIIAFVFAITTSNTISKEAMVIGTLRASGYTKGELIRHYMAMPMCVILAAALAGNVAGYTWFKDYAIGIYYQSFSLPTFVTTWNADAFVRTTVVPVILMFGINFFILANKLSLSPLKFIRRDLSKRQKKKAFKLNTKIGIMTRFKLRVIFQNIPNHITIFLGIFFADIILLLGMGFPTLLENYKEDISNSMFSTYQYVLKAPVDTKTEGAEPYCMMSLETIEGKLKSESVSVYGVSEDSAYISIDFPDDGIYISTALSGKFGVDIGDTLVLKEAYGEKEYTFRVSGIYDYPALISVFMSREYFCEVFDCEENYFNGYFSDKEILDIDNKYTATKITEDDMNKMSRQMETSLGGIFDIFYVVGLVMFTLIIYLLTKIVIEKNAQSISMTKILGYTNKEISRLYIMSNTIVVIGSFFVTMPIVNEIMRYVCIVMMSEYAGWLPFCVPFSTYVTILVSGIAVYAMVAFMQFWRVKNIPLDMALKNVE